MPVGAPLVARSPAAEAPAPKPPTATGAAAVATATAGTQPALQRSVEPTVRRATTSTDPTLSSTAASTAAWSNGSAPHSTNTPNQARPETSTALADRIDELLEQLEERVLIELERRGGRFAGYF